MGFVILAILVVIFLVVFMNSGCTSRSNFVATQSPADVSWLTQYLGIDADHSPNYAANFPINFPIAQLSKTNNAPALVPRTLTLGGLNIGDTVFYNYKTSLNDSYPNLCADKNGATITYTGTISSFDAPTQTARVLWNSASTNTTPVASCGNWQRSDHIVNPNL